jgi:type II secretory pathway pseudopilin PulG
MTMRRQGLTLLELIIATAIFSGMVVLMMEAILGMRGLAATVEDADILEEQAQRAKRGISRDFANSGWFYRLPGPNGRKFYPQIHLSEQKSWQPEPITPRPTVTIPLFDPVTVTMVPTTFTASVSLNQATLLGDAIVFTRLQPEGQPLSDTPAPMSAAIVDFDRQPPLRLDQYANARPVQSLIINPDLAEQSDVTTVLWETNQAGLTPEQLFDDNNIRLFAYRVVPDPVTGRGQLIRFYSNPGADRNTTAGWIQDQVIATDVVSLRIYSFEMSSWYAGTDLERDYSDNLAAGLTNNQLRFVIQFARNLTQRDPGEAIDVDARGTTTRDQDNTRASTVKTMQFTVGLRSITNSNDQ